VDLKDIKAIIDLMRKNDLSVFELEKDGFKLKLVKGAEGQPILTTPIALAPGLAAGVTAAAPPPGAAAAESPGGASQPATAGESLKDITSPMVGTFYLRPSQDQPAFVKVGGAVQEGDTVCLVEVMKMFNTVKAHVAGTVERILIENGKPVQHDQIVMMIKPAQEA